MRGERNHLVTGFDLFLSLLFWTGIFVLIALVWTLLFSTGILPETTPISSVPFNLINFIVAIFFARIILDSINAYTSGPRRYRVLLNQIDDVAGRFFSLQVAIRDGEVLLEEPVQIVRRGRVVEVTTAKAMESVKNSLINMSNLALAIFIPETFLDLDPPAERRNASSKSEALVQLNRTLDKLYRLTAILEKKEIYTHAAVILLGESMQRLRSTLHEMDLSLYVVQPSIFNVWILGSIAVYFGFIAALFWFPFRFWMLLIYPLVLLVVWGIWIISRRLRNPFHRQLEGETFMNFHQWRDDVKEGIERRFKRKSAPVTTE